MSFPSNLRFLRRKKDLSQTELGDLVGVEHSAISRYERATSTPSVEVLEKLAQVFEISIEELRGGELTASPAPTQTTPGRKNVPVETTAFRPSRTPAKYPVMVTVELDGTPAALERAYARLAIMNDAVADTD